MVEQADTTALKAVAERRVGSIPTFSTFVDMMEQADMRVSKTCAFGRVGSTPTFDTKCRRGGTWQTRTS